MAVIVSKPVYTWFGRSKHKLFALLGYNDRKRYFCTAFGSVAQLD